MSHIKWKTIFYIYLAAFAVVFGSAVRYSSTAFAGETRTAAPTAVKMSPDKRFIDNGDNTITDTKTGLMWMKQDSFLHTGHWKNWFQALDYIKQLNEEGFANHHDWEAPTVEELKTLYDSNKFNSSQVGREMKIHIDPLFAKEGSGSSWSGQANGIFQAFGVVFNDGGRFSHPKRSKARKSIRAVRHLQP